MSRREEEIRQVTAELNALVDELYAVAEEVAAGLADGPGQPEEGMDLEPGS